jgi:SPP1 gp7 family putative phage head morphogenesis protein
MNPFLHASEATIRIMAGFDVPAAEKMASSLLAARGMGAYDAAKKIHHRRLTSDPAWQDYFRGRGEDEPDMPFGVDWETTPEAALRYLRDKVPTTDWRRMKGLQDGFLRQEAFWIQGIEQQSLLEDVLQGLVDAVDHGDTLREFREAYGDKLAEEGLGSGRVQSLFRTYTHAAYQQSQGESYKANPLVENLTYTTAGDDAVRDEHAAWDGICLPKDHEFWNDHTPPCGWNCRCVLTVSEADDKPTALDDERLKLPPSQGFGSAKGDLLEGRIADQAQDVPRMVPADQPAPKLAAKESIFAWLDETSPAGRLPKGSGRPSIASPAFISMPDRRAVALTQPAIDAAPADAREWIRAALQGPSEAWAAPYRDPKGRIVLVLNVLLAVGDRCLCVPVVSGTVPAYGIPVHFVNDPRTVRRGGRVA